MLAQFLDAVDQRCTSTTRSSNPNEVDLHLAGGPMFLSVLCCTLAILNFCYHDAKRARKHQAKTIQEGLFHTPSLAARTIHMANKESKDKVLPHWRLGGVAGQVGARTCTIGISTLARVACSGSSLASPHAHEPNATLAMCAERHTLVYSCTHGPKRLRKGQGSCTHAVVMLPSFPAIAVRLLPLRAQVEDLQQIKRLLQERHTMRMRVGAEGAVRTDGSLTISDVPTLLKMIKESIEPTIHKVVREASGATAGGARTAWSDATAVVKDAHAEPYTSATKQM
jgi:hypothetical protein